MSAKKKTPAERNGLGFTGKIRPQNTSKPTFRQHIKQIIICSCVWGLIPVGVAEWLIRKGGLTHD